MENGIIFLCMIHIATGSLFKTAYRVDDCPEANDITAWKKASLRLNCSEFSEKYSVDVLKGQNLYHCLPSSFLNETIEFCGPNAAVERGDCPIYNYEYGATTATSHSCKHFTKGCPDPKHSPYHSSSFYKYKACWDINKESQCFYAEPDCPQREDKRYVTTSVDLGTSSSTDEDTTSPNAAAIVLGCIMVFLTVTLIGVIFYFCKYWERSKKNMDSLLRDENGPDIEAWSNNNAEVLGHVKNDNPSEMSEMETHLRRSLEDMDSLLRDENGPDIEDWSNNNAEVLGNVKNDNSSEMLEMETHLKHFFEDMDSLLRDENGPDNEDWSNNNAEVLGNDKNDNSSEMSEMETHLRRSLEDIRHLRFSLNSSSTDSSSVGDFNSGEQMKIIKNMQKAAPVLCFNTLLEKLKVTMTPKLIENIKCRLQDRTENSQTVVTEIRNADQLLNYLNREYVLFNNVCFLQGLFLACEAPELYEMCLDYAKTEEMKVIFLEKKISENDPTKVQYFINIPKISSFPKSYLKKLRTSLAIILSATSDDVKVSGVKSGHLRVLPYRGITTTKK